MLREIQESKLGVVGCGIFAMFLVLFLLTPFNGVQLIGLAAVPVLFVAGTFLNKLDLDFKSYDMLWVALWILGVISICWVSNIASAWNPFFILTISVLGMFCIRSVLQEHIILKLGTLAIYGIFLFLLLQQMVAIHYEIPTDGSWNAFLFKNRNYTTVHLLSLYPFLLFAELKGKFVRFMKVICGAMIANILIITVTDARSATLAFVMLLFFFLYARSKSNFRINTAILTLVLVIALVGIIGLTTFQADVAQYVYGEVLNSRLGLIDQTIQTISANPILGVGIGNWMIDSYQYASPETGVYLSDMTRLHSHNQILRMCSELGIIGGILFMIAMVYPLAYVFKKSSELTWQSKAAGGSLLVYLITFLFYTDVNTHNQHFSAIQFMAFFSIAIITRDLPSFTINKNFTRVGIGILGLISICWFVMMRSSHRLGSRILYGNLNQAEKLIDLKKVYQPNWYTHYNGDISYALLLSQEYMKSGDLEKAQRYYEKALAEDPYNRYILESNPLSKE